MIVQTNIITSDTQTTIQRYYRCCRRNNHRNCNLLSLSSMATKTPTLKTSRLPWRLFSLSMLQHDFFLLFACFHLLLLFRFVLLLQKNVMNILSKLENMYNIHRHSSLSSRKVKLRTSFFHLSKNFVENSLYVHHFLNLFCSRFFCLKKSFWNFFLLLYNDYWWS